MYKERIIDLMQHCKDDPDLMTFVEERVNKFVDYVAYTSFMEIRIQRLGIEGISGDQWRDEVTKLDGNRRSKHDVAIDAANQLNRLSASYDLPPFYEGAADPEHRIEVGDMCQQVCDEYFEGRHLHPLKIEEMMNEQASGKSSEQEASEFASSIAELSEESESELAL